MWMLFKLAVSILVLTKSLLNVLMERFSKKKKKKEKEKRKKKEKVCFCPNFLKASQRPTINLMKTHRTQKLFLN
jgi:hypothetical protein